MFYKPSFVGRLQCTEGKVGSKSIPATNPATTAIPFWTKTDNRKS